MSLNLRHEWPALILAIAALGLGLDCVLAPHGLSDLLILRGHAARLEQARAELRADNDSLRAEVQKLRSDNAYLCRLIRRELGYARPGEIIYRFASDSAAPAEH